MNPSKCLELSNVILDDVDERFCEIYKITNIENNKIYVGQAVSHILNHKRYRPYGHIGRFKCHISEAFSKKPNQSQYLNNAIRKYGVENFEVELVEFCKLVKLVRATADFPVQPIPQFNQFPNSPKSLLTTSTFQH